jgi:nucleoid DNA-binding protein
MSSKSKRKSTYSKGQLAADLAAKTGDISKSKVSELLGHLQAIAASQLKSAGVFTLPGMVKLTVKRKAATAARKGRNPFTGAEIMIKAKSARNVVRVRALKAMKDVV